MASSVTMFREVYPNASEFEIHSFEIDDKLRPYFASYISQGIVNAHIPVGVGDTNSNMTVYLEGAWYPGKINNNRDMQWGGGSLFAFTNEKKTNNKGGLRHLNRHVTVPVIDLSQWIQNNTRQEDYVILKLDVEGAEYGILKKMITDNTFAWIDKYYGEYHPWQPTGLTSDEKKNIVNGTSKQMAILNWAAETKTIADLITLQSNEIPADTPGAVGKINSRCHNASQLSIVVEVGMDRKNALLLIDAVKAHAHDVPLTLFLYGNFVEQHPELVLNWSKHSEIGIRGSNPMPDGLWERQNPSNLRLSVISTVARLRELGLLGIYFLPLGINENVINIAKENSLRLINSTITFPPIADYFTYDKYFKYRDVERIPKALKIIHTALENTGGILSLDSDFPDSYLISAFLLDYVFETSNFEIVSLRDCLR
ncbi:uncharacterized protein LOC144356735 [Saccoglossus kowalevskii]